MPTYTYRCTAQYCGEITEVQHHMQDKPRIPCAWCGGETHKVILEFPHTAFDWKHYQSRDDNMRLVLHASHQGRPSPASEQAGKRT